MKPKYQDVLYVCLFAEAKVPSIVRDGYPGTPSIQEWVTKEVMTHFEADEADYSYYFHCVYQYLRKSSEVYDADCRALNRAQRTASLLNGLVSVDHNMTHPALTAYTIGVPSYSHLSVEQTVFNSFRNYVGQVERENQILFCLRELIEYYESRKVLSLSYPHEEALTYFDHTAEKYFDIMERYAAVMDVDTE